MIGWLVYIVWQEAELLLVFILFAKVEQNKFFKKTRLASNQSKMMMKETKQNVLTTTQFCFSHLGFYFNKLFLCDFFKLFSDIKVFLFFGQMVKFYI